MTERVYKAIVGVAAKKVRGKELREPVTFDVKGMPAEALSKVRHVGAWAVAKVLSNERQYVRDIMTSTVSSTRKSVQERAQQVQPAGGTHSGQVRNPGVHNKVHRNT